MNFAISQRNCRDVNVYAEMGKKGGEGADIVRKYHTPGRANHNDVEVVVVLLENLSIYIAEHIAMNRTKSIRWKNSTKVEIHKASLDDIMDLFLVREQKNIDVFCFSVVLPQLVFVFVFVGDLMRDIRINHVGNVGNTANAFLGINCP